MKAWKNQKSLCRWDFISTSTWGDCAAVPTNADVFIYNREHSPDCTLY